MGYRDFESTPLTDGSSIQKGSVGLEHLDPALFQQVQLIKLHTHTGVDSPILQAPATPYEVKSNGAQIREEHGLTNAGTVTFTTPFISVPTILLGPTSATATYVTGVSTTGFTLNGGSAYYLAIGR